MSRTTSPRFGHRFIVLFAAAAAFGCNSSSSKNEPAPGDKPAATSDATKASSAVPPTPWKAGAIAHGGVGSKPNKADGCRAAVDRALAVLAETGDPVEAAAAGVVVLEDDERFNAGVGSRVRIDGLTTQMDAAVMTSAGRFGAVAVIEHVKNPVLVARDVLSTPHLLIAGDGATRFARAMGHKAFDPATPRMRKKALELRRRLETGEGKVPSKWKDFDWQKAWNFERSLSSLGKAVEQLGSDTVGVAVRAPDGRFAVALSTGGTAVTLRGRVGDVPIVGAGLYAGSHGAAAATGTGERIIENASARTVQGDLRAGLSAQQAADRAVEAIRGKGAIGMIVVSATELAASADRPMAWAAKEQGGSFLGPDPTAAPAPK